MSDSGDRSQAGPDNAPGGVLDEAAMHPTEGGSEAAALRAALDLRGHPPAGDGRCRPRGSIGARSPAHLAARIYGFRQAGVREPGRHFGIAYLQSPGVGKLHPVCGSTERTPRRARYPSASWRKPESGGELATSGPDTVHQGHQQMVYPGIYHINAVDTVTQWQVVGCVETICENRLVPVLESMLHQFPFRILSFHCDNGSEFINQRVRQRC